MRLMSKPSELRVGGPLGGADRPAGPDNLAVDGWNCVPSVLARES